MMSVNVLASVRVDELNRFDVALANRTNIDYDIAFLFIEIVLHSQIHYFIRMVRVSFRKRRDCS